LEDRTLLSAGQLDPAFGAGGLVTTSFPGGSADARSVAIQDDGSLVVAGTVGGTRFGLARYGSDGTLDDSFGNGGLVTTSFPGFDSATATSMALQNDGNIVVAGYVSYFVGTQRIDEFALARYNSDGSLDGSFGAGGLVVSNSGSHATGIALQADGRIVAVGSTAFGAGSLFRVVRYNTGGTLDSSFGSGGTVTTSFSGYQTALANAVTLQPDGRILVGGEVAGTGFDRFGVARYTSFGSLDTTFGSFGLATATFSNALQATVQSLAVQDDGRIVAAGSVQRNTTTSFALARFNSTGFLDPSFGTGGTVTTDFPGFDNASGSSLAVQLDDAIVVAGSVYNGNSPEQFGLARYDSDGNPDQSFGNGGQVTTDFGFDNAAGRSVAIQSDARIVVAGFASGFALARYQGDTSLATSFDISAPDEMTAGQPFDVTVTAVDVDGDVVPDYVGTVTLTSTDPLAPLLRSHTFTFDDGGVFTFTNVRLYTADSQSLFADDGYLSGQADLTVDPGIAIAIVLDGPSHARAGVPIVVTVTAVDAWGNVATGYRGNVYLEATDPDADLPDAWDFTADDAGSHDFIVTLNTPGSVRLAAHDSRTGWIDNLDLTVT
jgi:uncharacterized delta-60 repeat protein